MTEYAQVLLVAIPGFVLLILAEYLVSIYKGVDVYRGADTISSLSSGMTNIIKDVLGLAVVITSYGWMLKSFNIVTFEAKIIHYIIAFVVLDFAGYWTHRWEHVINVFWNRHVIHHSSEEFNLACALRQNISVVFKWFGFLLLPAALLGVPSEVIGIIGPIHLFAQFWYHTRLIDRMGILEHIIVTPSHHRVHHAINTPYIDKNYGQIFIIWDKMFGTFKEEEADEPPVYGILKPAKTFNPILINFQHLALLIKDTIFTSSWKDKITLWFRKTGYRPGDRVSDRIETIEDVTSYQKYNVQGGKLYLYWSWFQLTCTLAAMLYFFTIIDKYPLSQLIYFGLYLFVWIYGYTSILDLNYQGIIADFVRLFILLAHTFYFGSWFNIPYYFMFCTVVVSLLFNYYILISSANNKKLAI
jgi:sterol desaturase/sphingolipid hydroxylase (fatty acid hydroxylase superfamily)